MVLLEPGQQWRRPDGSIWVVSAIDKTNVTLDQVTRISSVTRIVIPSRVLTEGLWQPAPP